MAFNGVIFAGTLANINVAASAALGVMNPLLAQIDLTLFGSLGIGALQADLQAQLSAALQASVSIGIGISNPLEGFMLALSAIAVLQAQIQLGLSGALPTFSVEASLQLSVLASFSGMLTLKIGGLEALIQAALAVRLPAVNLAASLAASLSAGPLFVLSWEGVPLASAGASISAEFGQGLNKNGFQLAPGANSYGIVIVTGADSAWIALQATMLTQP